MKKIIIFSIILAVWAGISRAEVKMIPSIEKATFAGGCFWCMEKPFEKLPGVQSVISGYTGGSQDDPSYKEVSSGRTGHVEAVQITFDASVTPYDQLLEVYWRQIDPTDEGGQFADRGEQYTTAIFYHNDAQKAAAEASKKKLNDSKRFKAPIATKIIKASTFYSAEDYHQDYYKKNPEHYNSYRRLSGRAPFLERVWRDQKSGK